MAPITSTNGFILAGGRSLRMGRDKALLKWGNVSLLEHMATLLSTVSSPVRVVGRGEFLDRIPGKGPLGGILTALETTDRDANLFLAVDLPLLTAGFLSLFHSRFIATSKPLLACRIDKRFPLCLGIRKDLTSEIAKRIMAGNLAIHALIDSSDAEILEEDQLKALGFNRGMFANINAPEDWPCSDPGLQ
jgi:molybdenum cofactor guanylyltransferase